MLFTSRYDGKIHVVINSVKRMTCSVGGSGLWSVGPVVRWHIMVQVCGRADHLLHSQETARKLLRFWFPCPRDALLDHTSVARLFPPGMQLWQQNRHSGTAGRSWWWPPSQKCHTLVCCVLCLGILGVISSLRSVNWRRVEIVFQIVFLVFVPSHFLLPSL